MCLYNIIETQAIYIKFSKIIMRKIIKYIVKNMDKMFEEMGHFSGEGSN